MNAIATRILVNEWCTRLLCGAAFARLQVIFLVEGAMVPRLLLKNRSAECVLSRAVLYTLLHQHGCSAARIQQLLPDFPVSIVRAALARQCQSDACREVVDQIRADLGLAPAPWEPSTPLLLAQISKIAPALPAGAYHDVVVYVRGPLTHQDSRYAQTAAIRGLRVLAESAKVRGAIVRALTHAQMSAYVPTIAAHAQQAGWALQ